MTSPLQQKIRIAGPVVVTANRTADGAVVYWRGTGWTADLAEAAVAATAARAGELLAAAAADDLHAVGPYLAPVSQDGGGLAPGNLRERIRLNGPSFDLPVTFGI